MKNKIDIDIILKKIREKKMEFMKKNIKKYIILIISILMIIYILIQCKNQYRYIPFYIKGIQNTQTRLSFVCPFISKTITNDTFFTIAIGNNIFKNGFTNIDTLTWHENLKFPHSRNI